MRLGDAKLDAAAEAFAHHRTHRATQEFEFKGAGHHRTAQQPPGKHHQRVLLSGRLLRLGQAILVALAVLELEDVLGSTPAPIST